MYYYLYRTKHHLRAFRTNKPFFNLEEATKAIGKHLEWFVEANILQYLRYKIFVKKF